MSAMTWWLWALLAAVLGTASAGFAFLALSAGTAFGTNYHDLTPRQRTMARWLARGSLASSALSGLLGMACLWRGAGLLLARL